MRMSMLLGFTVSLTASLMASNAAAICEACTEDSNCAPEAGVCFFFEIDQADFCTGSCVIPTDCPFGYSCVDIGYAMNQCLPDTGSCTCDGSNSSLVRECEVIGPGDPPNICIGAQLCTTSGWGVCDPPLEHCDGRDNDCDGMIDEDFTEPCAPVSTLPPGGIAVTGALLLGTYCLIRFAGARSATRLRRP
jgi:hypothetical protein